MKNDIIQSITLKNFRNHESYKLDFSKNPTLILGKNGWGKTSILEAIYIALQGKSFRSVDKEILKREAEYYRIEVKFSNNEKVVVTYDGVNKKFLIKDKKYARLPKLNKYPVVLFLPEDLHIVATSPTRKREYFDRVIGQIDTEYSSALSRYTKALKQRNELLKQEFLSRDMLFSWDVLLAKYGVSIRKKRQEITTEFNRKLTAIYREIAKNDDEVEIRYDSYTVDVDESKYLRLLQMDYERDTLVGHTNFGVHKDDFNFIFNGTIADGSASRGETRSMVLALKFIEAEMLVSVLHKEPIILLDDVFSELDEERQKNLKENFSKNQVVITSVG
ncbi:DNA replication and repair protein RecF [Candidatus Saccharibacteria bacterium]|nr:DNA replication and repair protein RecF [Candidatus Saccharibacteria bacterium]